MFGKPNWFRPKTFGWGLVPVTWQGWIYSLVWALIISAPFLFLLLRTQWIEAVVWMVAAIGVLTWDVRAILRAINAAEQANTFYIGEDDAEDHVETENYDLHVRE